MSGAGSTYSANFSSELVLPDADIYTVIAHIKLARSFGRGAVDDGGDDDGYSFGASSVTYQVAIGQASGGRTS